MHKKLKAGLAMRILIDSSTLIALAKIGELGILKRIFGIIHITTKIKDEILKADSPEEIIIKEALDTWIEVLDFKGEPVELRKYGLDLGEASLFLVASSNDRLIIDESNARRFAESKGLRYTGLIGLLVAAVKTNKIPYESAIEILNKLAKGDFRLSSDLYIWARAEIIEFET
jgi:predicted nucleic acid-binding protein